MGTESQVGRGLKDRPVQPFPGKTLGKGAGRATGWLRGCDGKGTENHRQGLMSVEVRQAAVRNPLLDPEQPAKTHGRKTQRD